MYQSSFFHTEVSIIWAEVIDRWTGSRALNSMMPDITREPKIVWSRSEKWITSWFQTMKHFSVNVTWKIDSERLTTRHNGMSWRVLWINVCCFTSTVTCQTGSSCMNFLSTKNYWEYVRRRRPRAFKGSYIDGLNLSSILWVFALERRNLSKWFRCG